MFYFDTSRDGKPVYDPIINQSLDNYLMNDLALPGRGLMLYINAPCVIIGKNQNAYAEVDMSYMHEHDITLVRRNFGGGAVFHDYGNLIFENIIVDEEGSDSHFGDFGYYAEPIMTALKKMGLAGVAMSGRNDIAVNGAKISGMCMSQTGNVVGAGGTLLFDLDGSVAKKVLTPNQAKLHAKGIKSVDKRITNLKPLLPEPYGGMNSLEFKEALLKKIFAVDDLADMPTYKLTDEDWAIIDERVAKHYGTKAWNYGKNPGYKYYVTDYFTGTGTVSFNFSVEDGKIVAFKTYGDMLFGDVSAVDDVLTGTGFNKAALEEAFKACQSEKNIGNIPVSDLADLVLSAQ